MDRYWLLTWTTYGSWLPGDDRGFVSNVRDGDGPEVRHNIPGTEPKARQRGLVLAAREKMQGEEVRLAKPQAESILEQFQETARVRGWELQAVAIMSNHVHVVVGVKGDPDSVGLLRDCKSYSSGRLNRSFGKPTAGTWWTESGSRRKLPHAEAVARAVEYVRKQAFPLVVWVKDTSDTLGIPGERGA